MKTLKTITLKGNPKYDEKWLQNEIANNPAMLGLGDIELRAKEKIQSSGGQVLNGSIRHLKPNSGAR